MTVIGYTRVSTPGQDAQLQRDALQAAGVEKLFEDVGTGKKLSRPGLDQALAYCRPGDTLVVWRLDRLARSLKDLLDLVDRINKARVHLRSLHEQIDTCSANGRLILHVFAALAEFEASLLAERTRAGLVAARAHGRNAGRKKVLTVKDIPRIKRLMKEHGQHEAARRLKVSTRTLQRVMAAGIDQLDQDQPDLMRDIMANAMETRRILDDRAKG